MQESMIHYCSYYVHDALHVSGMLCRHSYITVWDSLAPPQCELFSLNICKNIIYPWQLTHTDNTFYNLA